MIAPNPKQVVHLTSAHPALDSRIFEKECCSLREYGYDVAVVAQHPRDEVVAGINIHALRRPVGRVERMTGTVVAVLRKAAELRAHVYHIHDPELLPFAAWLKLRGAKVVYDAHEDTRLDILEKAYLPAGPRHVLSLGVGMLESFIGRVIDGVVAATPTIAGRFPSQKSVVVRNYPRVEHFTGIDTSDYSKRPHNALYVGTVTDIRGALQMIKATAMLPTDLNARLVVAGVISPPHFAEEVRRMPEWRVVDDLGWQSRAHVVAALARARLGFAVLHPTIPYMQGYPIKLYEYMAAGLPVIASDFPLWREIVEPARCGILVDPLNTTAIAEAAEWLLRNPNEAARMGQCGREAAIALYNWSSEEKKLISLYEKLARPL